eukprot:Skav204881  [mRNA]  locus=scaffold2602:68886:69161:- [translate_table: standard]
MGTWGPVGSGKTEAGRQLSGVRPLHFHGHWLASAPAASLQGLGGGARSTTDLPEVNYSALGAFTAPGLPRRQQRVCRVLEAERGVQQIYQR